MIPSMYASLWIAVVLVAGAWAIPKAGNPSPDHLYHHSVRKDAPLVDKEAKREARQAVQSTDCAWGCPKGWSRFIFSYECYKLPPQPAEGNTFWEWERRCQAADNRSHIMVVDGILEQAKATAMAIPYAFTWIPNLGTSFLWLGGYTKEKQWKFLDGTDQTGNILFTAAGLAAPKDNFCLSGDPLTLGIWSTRTCDSAAGSAICEMEAGIVCGERGDMFPFPAIDLSFDTFWNLFPKFPQIPFIHQIMDSLGLNSAISYVGDTIKCLFVTCKSSTPNPPKPLRPSCKWGCPPGWYTYGNINASTSQCYKFPQHTLDRTNGIYQGLEATKSTYAEAVGTCADSESTARLMLINSPLEMATIEALLKKFQWQKTNPGAFLWLGAKGANGWSYEDSSYDKGNLLMSLAALQHADNGQCVAADLSGGGKWFLTSCDQTNGMYFCEMPRKPICDGLASGTDIDFINVPDMSVEHVKELFPKMPDAPFLEDVINGRNGQQGIKNNSLGHGADIVNIMCVKYAPGGWLAGNPSYKPYTLDLNYNDKPATTYGEWSYMPCNLRQGYAKYAFKVSATAALSAWSRCYNKGYELAMPVYMATNNWPSINWLASKNSGWYPFQVGDQINEYYDEGWTVYTKIPRSKPTC